MDLQLTQYLRTLGEKWKMLQNYGKFPNRNVLTYLDTYQILVKH